MTQPFPIGEYWFIRHGEKLMQFATWLDAWEYFEAHA